MLSGSSGQILEVLGALVKWAFSGFKGSYKSILNDDMETPLKKTVQNQLLGLALLLLIIISLGLLL